MKKTKNSAWKRVAAGALSMALVAGAMPANVGGFLTGGNGLVAHAASVNAASGTTTTIATDTDCDYLSVCDHSTLVINQGVTLTLNISDGYAFSLFDNSKMEVHGTLAGNVASGSTWFGNTYINVYLSDGAKYTATGLSCENGDNYLRYYGYDAATDGNGTVSVKNGEAAVTSESVGYKTTSYTYTATPENGYVFKNWTKGAGGEVIGTDPSIEVTCEDNGKYQVYANFESAVTKTELTEITESNPNGDYTAPINANAAYTGSAQALLNAGTIDASKGTFQYVLGTNGDSAPESGWGTTIPEETNAGNYYVWYKIIGAEGYNDVAPQSITATIAKADLTAGTDYTAPTGSNLNYTGNEIALLEDGNTGSVNVDSITGEPVGTMEYGIAGTKEANIIKNTESAELAVGTVSVGGIYSPVDGDGISFPNNYTKYVLDGTLYTNVQTNGRIILFKEVYAGITKLYWNDGLNPALSAGCDSVKVTALSDDTITFESYNSALETIDWKTTVPTAKDVGEYKVYYRVKGDANHNDSSPAYVTSKIDYKKSTLTLAASLGAVKVTEVANGTETEVTAVNGAYTLSATKTYKIYTKNTVSTDEKSKYRLTEAYHNKANDDDVFEYEYTLTLAVDPAFGAYNLSHLSNWTGKVYSSDPTKLYIADGAVTEGTGKLAATLKANSTYYYGDLIDDSSVEIDEAYKDLLKVNKIYFSDSTGANVDINKAKFGTYTLTAEIVVDNNANGKFDDKDIDLSYTVYKDVEYKARPMEKNDYFVEIPDGKIKLTVDNGTVTVPEKYYVYSDMIGGSGSDKKYVTTEKNDALSVIFSKCEEKQTFTYNGTEQKPTIIVKNGGNNADVVASIPATDTADAVAKDYIDGVKAKTDAGDYSFKLTAEAGTAEAPANYSGAITVKWTIGKADIQQYISVAPKNNVDTDNVVGNDAIVYDGAVLDGTDFEVKTTEAYAALTDSDADKATKALVDEFIAQLKGTPAVEADPANNIEAQPAVPAKTVVEAEAANAGEYPKSMIGNPKENTFLVTPENSYNIYLSDNLRKSDNTDAANDDIIIMPKANDNDASVEFKVYDISEYFTVIRVYSDGRIAYEPYESNPIFVDATLPNTTEYGWYIEQTGTRVLNQGTENEKTVKVFTISAKKYPTGELKNAGEHKANVTVSNSNFKSVKIEGVDVEIAKRDVTLTPDDDLSITYRDTVMPDLTYTIEDAKADGLTGVVAADKALFQKTTGEGADAVTTNTGAIYVDKLVQEDAQAVPVQFVYATDENNATDYTTAGLNNAGSYKYAVINDAKFDNYNIVLPVDIAADEAQGIEEYTAPTFTVAPLNLNNIADLQIVLNGVTPGWTQDGNSGYYTYDGTTKAVEVKKVAYDVSEPVEFSADALISEKYTAEKSFEKNGVNLVSDSGYVAGNDMAYDCFGIFGDKSLTVTVPEGKTIDRIHYTYGYIDSPTFNNPNEATIKTYTNEKIISVKDVNSNTFTLSLSSGQLAITNVSVEYSSHLTAETDYTVGGATKRASANNNHEVQVMGKGNYTGVAKAPWQIVTAEAGGAALTLANATKCEEGASYDYSKTYDGKAVTGAVAFTDPTSDYAVDAEVEYKYYQGKYTKEEVTAADFNAAAIDAPVNAFYPDGNNVYHFDADYADYTVVATITCDGYADQVLVKTVHITPINLTVNAAAKNITYGDTLPAVTQADIDAINGLTDTDKEYFQKLFTDGKLKFRYLQTVENTYDNNKIQIIPIISTEEEISAFRNVVLNYNTDNYYWNITNKAKSIKSDDVTVEFTNGNTVVLDENGFAAESSIIVKDTGILNDDGEPTVLLADTDYELNIESTATEGEYIVEIVGKGNYRAIRKVTFTAVAEEETVPKFNINASVARINKGNVYTGVSYSYKLYDGWTLVNYGILYCNDGTITNPADLTLDSTNASIQKKESKTGTNLLDTGKGVVAVGYLTATSPSGVTKTFYSDNIGGKVVNINVNDTVIRINDKNKQLYVGVSYSIKPASNLTVESYGILYCNDGTITDPADLTLDSENASIQKKADKTGTNLLDTGKGVVAVGYNVVEDSSGNTAVIYTGNIGGRAVNITENDPVARTNAGKEYVGVSYAIKPASGLTVESYGILYCNDGTITNPADLTLDSTNASVQKKDGKTGTNLLDTGNGVIAVGYNVVKNDAGQEAIIYTDNIGGKYSELVG